MRGYLLIFILFLLKQVRVRSVRLVELRVPGHAAAGGEALLGCQFDTIGDTLYSIKWYKDGREFYRYVPRNKHPTMMFTTPGVYVDMSRSSSDVVTLTNLERNSSGLYRCEVAGEAPLFTTTADEKYMTIHVLPQIGPRVTGLHHAYRIGDRLTANCSSSSSRPEAQLKWLVNGKAVPKDRLRGPWYRVSDPPDTTETIMQMNFKILPSHFKRGLMEVKCQATIAPLYQQEVLYRISEGDESLSPWSKEIDDSVHVNTPETTTPPYPYDEEDQQFRKNAIYEIRQRLYRRLNFRTTTTLEPHIEIYSSKITGDVQEKRYEDDVIRPKKLDWPPTYTTMQSFPSFDDPPFPDTNLPNIPNPASRAVITEKSIATLVFSILIFLRNFIAILI